MFVLFVCFFFFVSGLLNRIRNLLLFVKLVMFASDVLCFFFVLFVFFLVCSLSREGLRWGVCSIYILFTTWLHKSVDFPKLCILMIFTQVD